MPKTKAFFDEVFEAIDPVLDEVYAKTFYYRVTGYEPIEITASLRAHEIEAEHGPEGYTDSWHGHVFEVLVTDLFLNGEYFVPAEGHEILEQISQGYQVFRVVAIPKKRCFEPVDAEETKLLVFTHKRRIEAL